MTREVDAGLVYASDAVAAGDSVTTVEVPEAADAPTTYAVATLEQGDDDLARRALASMRPPAARVNRRVIDPNRNWSGPDDCITAGAASVSRCRSYQLSVRPSAWKIAAGREPDNFIDPRALGVMERRLLKEAFKLILSVQEKTRKKYGALMTL